MTTLLARLHHPDTAAAFAAKALGLPATTLVSLTLPLPAQPQDWLNRLPAEGPWWYHARPARGEYLLAIGNAARTGCRACPIPSDPTGWPPESSRYDAG